MKNFSIHTVKDTQNRCRELPDSIFRLTAPLCLCLLLFHNSRAAAAGVDLAVQIRSAPTYLMNDVAAIIRLEVANRSPRSYSGGSGYITLTHGPVVVFNTTGRHSTNGPAPSSPAFQAEYAIPAMAANSSTVLNVSIVPTDLPFVPHMLNATAFGPGDINRANSTDQVQVFVVPPQPDLVVAAITVAPSVNQFRSTRVVVRIHNRGTAAAFGGCWVGLGLSLDRIPMNGNDIPLGVFWVSFNRPLLVGESRPFVFYTLPIGNAFLGTQYVIAGLDFHFQIPEGNEWNNVGWKRIQVVR